MLRRSTLESAWPPVSRVWSSSDEIPDLINAGQVKDIERYAVDGIYLTGNSQAVDLIQIYQCFCDETRLRIVNLLQRGPLCVCHLQELLDEPQVKISKHLAYMKEKGIVHAQRHQNWMIYSLPQQPAAELDANLKCLQDCVQTHPVFKADLRRLQALGPKVDRLVELSIGAEQGESCCPQRPAKSSSRHSKAANSKR